MVTLAALLVFALQDSPSVEDDHVHIADADTQDFFRQWAEADEKKEFQTLLGLYDTAYKSCNKLAQPDPDVPRWIPLYRVVAAKVAALPDSELAAREIVARQELESTAPALRRRANEKYSYTRAGREALDLMANLDADQGRLPLAMRGWSRAFEVRPTAETVARLAFAHALRDDPVSLTMLRSQAETRSVQGSITVGGRKKDLFEYLDSLKSTATPGHEVRESTLLRPSPGPSSEIPLGHYNLRDEGRYGDRRAVGLPTVARLGDKTLVVFTNGLRTIAVDAARAEGGTLEDAVEWRHPKSGPTRSYSYGGYDLDALPYVGVTVAGDRAYCNMFPEQQHARQQVGKRSQSFLGPPSLRALSLSTGDLLWDTDQIEVDVDGRKIPLQEHLNVHNIDFCFGGPPLVRGERLYAALMTSPKSGRQCWVLCLEAATGKYLWHAPIGDAPNSKLMSIATLAEEEGTLVVSTNFGIVAALDSSSGTFEWVVKYPKSSLHRYAASPPVIAGSLVYVLAQDGYGLMAFDRWTGLEAPLPRFPEEQWDGVVHLVGRAGDWLAFSGQKNFVVRPEDGQVVPLPATDGDRFGRGAIANGRLYLPTRSELLVFDTGTWKLTASHKWAESGSAGNLAVSDTVCVHMTDRLDLSTSADLLRDRFAPLVDVEAAKPADCRQYARILEAAGRPKEAVRYYRRALKVWEADPAWQETAEGLKKKLADLAEKLGDDFPKE